jgi:two-component system, response regulator, stage 0 sporulation protein F
MTTQDAKRHGRTEGAHAMATHPGAKILLVEDDFELRSILAGALRRHGYAVVEAAHGDEALEWLGPGVLDGVARRLPALVVSDIRMPYFSGLEIVQCLQLTRRKVPVILITGFGDPDTHVLAHALGASCVLDKPFDVEDLLGAVHGLLAPGEPRRSVLEPRGA